MLLMCRALSLDGWRHVTFIDDGLMALTSLKGVASLNLQARPLPPSLINFSISPNCLMVDIMLCCVPPRLAGDWDEVASTSP